MQTLLDVT